MTKSKAYWARVRSVARRIGSDGCTSAPEFYHECCLEHDLAYRGHDIENPDITRAEADTRFRHCIQARSRFGRCSPLSWWRYAGVRLFGRRAYHKTPAA